jgi:predicted lipid-binding transport protein (Tim44 family)
MMEVRMRPIFKVLPVVMSAGLILSACGTSTGDRGLSGGLLGAGTGATIGALAGSAGTGALWGGLGGAAIGMLTSPDMINLGKPIWNRSASSSSHAHKYASRSSEKSSGKASAKPVARTARNDERCSTRETASQRITTCAKAY